MPSGVVNGETENQGAVLEAVGLDSDPAEEVVHHLIYKSLRASPLVESHAAGPQENDGIGQRAGSYVGIVIFEFAYFNPLIKVALKKRDTLVHYSSPDAGYDGVTLSLMEKDVHQAFFLTQEFIKLPPDSFQHFGGRFIV